MRLTASCEKENYACILHSKETIEAAINWMDDGKFSYLVPVLYLWLVSTHSIECSVSACHIAILPPYLSAAASAASGRGPARPCSLPSRLSQLGWFPWQPSSGGGGGCLHLHTGQHLPGHSEPVHSWCRHGGAAAGLLDDPGEPWLMKGSVGAD